MERLETKDCLNKFCLLNPDYLTSIRENICPSVPTKNYRPYLIVELSYRGKAQLFAIPTQTSVKKSLDTRFWHKLPSRLETKQCLYYGLLYSTMIPIPSISIMAIKGADTIIPQDISKKQNLLNTLMKGNLKDVPEKARSSFAYMKKVASKVGEAAFNDRQFKSAYANVSKALHYKLVDYKNENIDKIKAEAQVYLTNHYEVLLAKRKDSNIRIFVDMPIHYTSISKLAAYAKRYEYEKKSSSGYLHEQQEIAVSNFENEKFNTVRQKLLEIGKNREAAKADAKLLIPLAEKELFGQMESSEENTLQPLSRKNSDKKPYQKERHEE